MGVKAASQGSESKVLSMGQYIGYGDGAPDGQSPVKDAPMASATHQRKELKMTATTLGNVGPISTSGSPRWRGQWIAPEARPALDLVEASLGGSTARGEFSRSIFRKAFHVTETPQAAPTRLT